MPQSKATRTVAAIDREIQRLQKERADAFSREVAGVVARIKEAIAHYGLTAADLGLTVPTATPPSKPRKRTRRTGAKPAASARRPSSPKYSDGKGHTWTGIGKRPGWLIAALAAGATEADLRVAQAAA